MSDMYVCMYVCMHVCTKSFLKTTTNSSCVCTHLANKADSDSDSDGKELSEDLKKIIVALHKDGVGYKKIAKTLKLSCCKVAKTIQRFNRTCSTQNRPRHVRPKKLSARAQRHIQRLCLGNRRMSAASIAAEVEWVGGQTVSAQTICRTLHQIGLHGCCPRRKPLLKMMHKKARKQFAEDKQTKDMDYWTEPCPVVWWDQDKFIWFRWCHACVAATR